MRPLIYTHTGLSRPSTNNIHIACIASSPVRNDSQVDSLTTRQTATSGDTPEQAFLDISSPGARGRLSKERGRGAGNAIFAYEIEMVYTTYIWYEGNLVKTHTCCYGQRRVIC